MVFRVATQEERREETRAKLLDATITSIAERGLAATTSRRVCELAEVSSGAQTHHFPRRSDLLAGAVERLAEQRLVALRESVPGLPRERHERLATLIDLWWADFNDTLFVVFVKLWVAAADDPELHSRLVPVERRMAEAITALWFEVMDEPIGPETEQQLPLTLAVIRGLALVEHFEPRLRRRRDQWPAVRRWLLHSLLETVPA